MSAEAKWRERVEAWQRSDQSAPDFCAGKGFQASTLRYWASRLRRIEREAASVRIARVVRATDAGVDTPIVVELGGARVGVRRGFDRDTLRALLDVLRDSEVEA